MYEYYLRRQLNFGDDVKEVRILGNGHKISMDYFKIKNGLCFNCYNLTFENYTSGSIFENNGTLLFDHCNFIKNSCHLVFNRGICLFDTCMFVKNELKSRDSYLINNEGSLNIGNSSFVDNSNKLIYNTGCVLLMNSTCGKCNGFIENVYNENCEMCNCTGFMSHSSYPESSKKSSSNFWHGVLRTTLGTVVAVSGFASGFLTAYYSTSAILGMIVGAVVGAGVGVGAAFIDAKVTGSDFGTIVYLYSSAGILAGVLGGIMGGIETLTIKTHYYDMKDAYYEPIVSEDYMTPLDLGYRM